MTSTSTSPSCRHSTQAPFPRCKFFSWLVRTEWTRLIGRGEREWKPPNYGDKRKKWKDKKDNTERLQGSLARHPGGSSWRLGHRLSQVKRNCSHWNCGVPVANDVVAPEMPRIWMKMILFRRDRLSEMLVMKVWNDGLTKLVCIMLATCLDYISQQILHQAFCKQEFRLGESPWPVPASPC